MDEQIRILCVKSDLSLAEMARRLGKTPQAFHQKLKRGSFSIEDLLNIALVSGCELKCEFVYPNGDRITVTK